MTKKRQVRQASDPNKAVIAQAATRSAMPVQKSVAEYSKKKTVPKVSDDTKAISANAFELFFSEMPPSTFKHYTKDVLLTGVLGAVQSVTERAIYTLDDIQTGDALFLTSIRQEMYGTYNFNAGFPVDFRFVNLPKDWGTMTKFPIGFNILANNASLFDATYRGDNDQTIPATVNGVASGMNINKNNVLDFGLLRTVLCVPENTSLEIEYKTFYFDDYGTPTQLPNTGPPNYYYGMGNQAEYTKIYLKGFTTTMKKLREMQEKYNF